MFPELRRLIQRKIKRVVVPRKPTLAYLQYKEPAREYLLGRIWYWAQVCQVDIKRVAIRDQRRRWGSCSSLGNLNFNYKLVLLPPCLSDYVIVHELCHLKELNHGPKFWALVAIYYPEYRALQGELRVLEQTTRMQPAAIITYVKIHQCNLCPNIENVSL